MYYAFASIPLLVWLYLLLARGGFWRVPRAGALPMVDENCSVVALIPARNEAACIGRAVTSLLQQRYTGPFHIVIIDDASEDDTATIAREAAQGVAASDRVTVLRAAGPPSGWTGKLWALAQGLDAAQSRKPEYLLLTDADIRHGPDALARLVTQAQSGGFDLVSLMVRLATRSRAERWLIPAFVFFFFKLYPPNWVESRRHKLAAAAGGCILVRAAALARIGGFASIRSQVIDDCALARQVKHTGGSIWLGLARSSESLRSYGSAGEIGAMIARTAFAQLRHSRVLVVLTVIGMCITYLVPLGLILVDDWMLRMLGFAAWLLMTLMYAPMVRFYRLNGTWSLALPFAALFYVGAVLRSAHNFAHGSGGQWKGRAQDLPG